ncbi:MAG: S8 family serine peptidase [Melioribacteraceae bacterium]|nr:S8 family serine peptidase [Melioribacteraceae bacterium]
MKKLLLLLVIISTLSFSQEKYYIYFKDKGIFPSNSLNKNSAVFKNAEKELTAAAIERRKSVMGENYITFEDLPIREDYLDKITSLGIKIENKLKWFNSVSAYLTDEQIKNVLNLPFIEKIEKVRSFDIPNTKVENEIQKINSVKSFTGLDYGNSFNQNNLSEIPAVHDLGFNGQNVILGILDTGFRWKNHIALKNLKIIAEKDFVQKDDITENQTGDASLQDAHGTAVLSLACGNAPGNLIGPAFGSTIILAKTENLSSETRVEEDNYAAALIWMESLGVQITTSSLGYNTFDNPAENYTFSQMNGNTTIVAKAANLAYQRGISTFTAAGNERGNSWGKIISPADAYEIIAVGAVNSSNQIASFSSPGPTSDGRIKPEIVAMGVSNYHALTGGSFGTGSGTSYATPIAAGIAALLKSTWPHLTNKQIRNIFLASGDNVSTPNNDRGYGLISAKKAVTFPNLQTINNITRLNKLFINSNGVVSPTIFVKINNNNYQSFAMNSLGSGKYYYDFNSLAANSIIEFYFTYSTTNGVNLKEPQTGGYRFVSNDLNVLTNLNENLTNEIPLHFELFQNYPNPFNPETNIKYSIPAVNNKSNFEYFVTLKVYDVLGNEIVTLVNENQKPGIYNYKFSSEKNNGNKISTGIYFYKLTVGDFSQTKKMILIK